MSTSIETAPSLKIEVFQKNWLIDSHANIQEYCLVAIYTPADQLSAGMLPIEDLLEEAFCITDSHEGPWYKNAPPTLVISPVAAGYRSTSVGDYMRLTTETGAKIFVVAGCGFREVDQNAIPAFKIPDIKQLT